MKKMKIYHLFAFICLLSFFLFSSAICEDDKSDISINENCVAKKFEKAEEIDRDNISPLNNFAVASDEELGKFYSYIVELENVCVSHAVNVTGTIFCNGEFCTGGFEWGAIMVVNSNEAILDPVTFDCHGGKCEFNFSVPADYTSLFNTYRLQIMLTAFGDPGDMDYMDYFAWKIDRFEIEVNYYTSE